MQHPLIRSSDIGAGAARPCITSSFQAECVVLVHMLHAAPAGHPGAVSRHVPPLSADARVSAMRWRRRWKLNLVNLRAAGAPGRACGRRTPTRAAPATRCSPSSPRSKATTPGSPALRRDQSASRANLQHESSRSRCRPERCSGRSARWQSWTTQDVWAYAKTTTSRCCRCTSWATPASAASPARRCPTTRQSPLGPLAGPEARVRHPHPGEAVATGARSGR